MGFLPFSSTTCDKNNCMHGLIWDIGKYFELRKIKDVYR